MAKKLTLYGFDGSTYVRTVKMLLHEKGADYEQVPVNVLAGEPRQPEHLERHPFGKVPVVDHGDFRLLETGAVTRYLNEVLPGKSLIPDSPKDRARMDMSISLHDSYGYPALLGLAGQHLFPDLVGGRNEEVRQDCLDRGRLYLTEQMKIRGDDPWIAGQAPSLADFYLAPVCFYVSLTEDRDRAFDVPGFTAWWERVQGLEAYKATEPDLG